MVCYRFVFVCVFNMQVRLGVIRHLADFFEQMSPDRREKHLNVLVEVSGANGKLLK